MLFCAPNVVYLYDIQMSTVEHFSVDSNKCEFGNKQKESSILMIFYDSQYLTYFRTYFRCVRNIRNCSEYPPTFPYLKNLRAIDPSFVTITKQLNNKIGETFCEGLK